MQGNKGGGLKFLQDRPGGPLGKILAALSPQAHSAVIANSRIKTIDTGDILLNEGEAPAEIGCVLSGALGMVRARADGTRHIIGLLTPGDLCGRLFDGANDFRIEALAPSKLYCFDRRFFETLLQQEAAAEILLLEELRDEIDAAREWLVLISGRQVLHRVAGFLALLARRTRSFQQAGSIRVHLPLTRVNIAQLLGTSPESLSRAFHKVADLGLIEIVAPNIFNVVDLAGLEAMADPDTDVNDPWPSATQKTVGGRKD